MKSPVLVTLRAGGGGSVFIGDTDISNAVQSVRISGGTSESRVTLEVAALITTVDGEATIGLPERTEAALVALGWTPPTDDGGAIVCTPEASCVDGSTSRWDLCPTHRAAFDAWLALEKPGRAG